jgi:hypothetical protein
MEVAEVRVPLYDNMTVRCTRSTKDARVWYVQPAIWHPHVFLVGSYMMIEENETLEEMLQVTGPVPNPSDLHASIALAKGEWDAVLERYRSLDLMCVVCLEESPGDFVFTCHKLHVCCRTCFVKNPKRAACPVCRRPNFEEYSSPGRIQWQ